MDGLAREFGGTKVGDTWLIQQTTVVPVFWHAPDSPLDGIPGRQTLERLICADVVAAYPGRGPSVQQWLDSRPGPIETKHFAWSYYAGWYAHHGAEDYYHRVWEDESVAAEIDARLRQTAVWPLIEEMAR